MRFFKLILNLSQSYSAQLILRIELSHLKDQVSFYCLFCKIFICMSANPPVLSVYPFVICLRVRVLPLNHCMANFNQNWQNASLSEEDARLLK